jgi:hypothetical protein
MTWKCVTAIIEEVVRDVTVIREEVIRDGTASNNGCERLMLEVDLDMVVLMIRAALTALSRREEQISVWGRGSCSVWPGHCLGNQR